MIHSSFQRTGYKGWLILFCTVTWLLLFGMALCFYEGRIYQDSSYYLMYAINTRWFHIEHGRPVLALAELLPLAGTWLHVPMKGVLMLNAINTPAVALVVFLLLWFVLRDVPGALAVLLLQYMGVLQGFFTPVFEMYYGAMFSVLLFSLLKKKKHSISYWLSIVLTEALVLFSHPLLFLVVSFISLWLWLEQPKIFLKKLVVVWVVMIATVVIKQLTFSAYESGKVGAAAQAIHQGVYLEFFKVYWLHAMVCFLLQQYPACLIMLLAVAALKVSRRKFLQPLLLFSFLFLTVCIVNLNVFGFGISRYREIEFYSMVPLFVIPFVYEAWRMKSGWLKRGLHLLIFLSIGFQASLITREWKQTFQPRTAMLKRFIVQAHGMHLSRMIASPANLVYSFPGVDWKTDSRSWGNCLSSPKCSIGYDADDWSLPIETMLLSAQAGKEKTVSIIRSGYVSDTILSHLSADQYIFRLNEKKPLTWMNKNYFTLPGAEYAGINNIITYPGSLKQFAANLSLQLDEAQVIRQGQYLLVPVNIKNGNNVPLGSSTQGGIFLSYHWLSNSEMKIFDGMRTPLEADVSGASIQMLRVILPEQPGSYELVADLVAEGRMWFQAPCNKIAITVN